MIRALGVTAAVLLAFLLGLLWPLKGEDPASWPAYGRKSGWVDGIEVWAYCDRGRAVTVFVAGSGHLAVIEGCKE